MVAVAGGAVCFYCARDGTSHDEPEDAEPWTSDLHSAMATAQSELKLAQELAVRTSSTAGDDGLFFSRCITELARVAAMQGDGFPAVFERVKVALKIWSAIPNDTRLNGDWNMAPDRGVTDQLIAACGPPFKVVWYVLTSH